MSRLNQLYYTRRGMEPPRPKELIRSDWDLSQSKPFLEQFIPVREQHEESTFKARVHNLSQSVDHSGFHSLGQPSRITTYSGVKAETEDPDSKLVSVMNSGYY